MVPSGDLDMGRRDTPFGPPPQVYDRASYAIAFCETVMWRGLDDNRRSILRLMEDDLVKMSPLGGLFCQRG